MRTHGKTNTREYKSWQSMIKRCLDENSEQWPYYGGRGIGVCARWREFENFWADMGPRPLNSSLDRIDTDGNYEPSNCRWSPHREQCRNRRNNINFCYNGVTQCLAAWADVVGIQYGTLKYRWRTGKRDAASLFRPPGK